jgi:trigger factor
MSTGEDDRTAPDESSTTDENGLSVATDADETPKKLELDVEISDVGPCRKHVKVAIPPKEISRQFDESLGAMSRDAAVPGFRPGHAPRTLVQRRFKKQVEGQVKSTLLYAALEQIDKDYKINPIAQPKLDIEAIALPEDGPMLFEMEVEVQPEFELPRYKDLTVKRFVKQITEADVDAQSKSFLERYAQLVPKLEGSAEIGDFITADLRFTDGDNVVNEAKEIQFRLQPELRFQDGRVPDLAGALVGAAAGDVREASAEVGSACTNPALRGKSIGVRFVVHDLKRYRLPEVNRAFLETIGFDSLEELRDALRELLERRLEFQRRQAARRELLDQLIAQVPFDLPSDLVARQTTTAFRNSIQEMRQAGMSEADIRAREAQLRANAHETTLRSLKEFFILAKIAEVEDIKVEDEDIEMEIEAIAARSDETPRRVRARIEKEELAESLASQILERKTIDRVLEYVRHEDVPLAEERAVETLDETAVPPSAEGENEAEAPADATAEGESKAPEA